MPQNPIFISSRDNALIKSLYKLKTDAKAYRKIGLIFVEGEHLCQSLLDFQQKNQHAKSQKKILIEYLVFAQSTYSSITPANWPAPWAAAAHQAVRIAVIADALWGEISDLPSPAGAGLVLRLNVQADRVDGNDAPAQHGFDPHAASVVLDGVQDAGNVGTILRTAAAMGFGQILALPGTAALFAPKVLRAGQGAHWGLRLIEGAAAAQALDHLAVPLLATSPHARQWLHRADLPHPSAWVFGHEGRGVRQEVLQRATQTLAIAQPGGQESLNVAAAAAICLHASATGAIEKTRKAS